jgi:adenylate kinase family enzyme
LNQRILVTGNAGSGKTTLAAEIGRAFSLPVFCLDQVVWRAGWKPTPKAERERLLRELADQPRWVLDGVSSVLAAAADLVILLDVSPVVCTWRCARRNLRYLLSSRPGLPENCPEWKIVPTLLRIIWRFDREERLGILQRARSARSWQLYWHVAGNAGRLRLGFGFRELALPEIAAFTAFANVRSQRWWWRLNRRAVSSPGAALVDRAREHTHRRMARIRGGGSR